MPSNYNFPVQCSLSVTPMTPNPKKRTSFESYRTDSVCSNTSLSRHSSRGSGQDFWGGIGRDLNYRNSQDGESSLSPCRKNSQDGFLAHVDKVKQIFNAYVNSQVHHSFASGYGWVNFIYLFIDYCTR